MVKNMKIGLQMYSIRSLAQEDLKQALKTAAEIGYQGVEFAGFFGHPAGEVRGWLEEFGLEAMGAHISEEELFDRTEETIAFHKAIGNHRMICPWADLKARADAEALAAKFRAAAPRYEAEGMKLYYHNHAHEFARDGGDYLIDILAEAAPDVLLEFDVYWVYRGGENPVAYLNKYAGRVEIFHAKDGNMETGTIAGTGNVPLPEVVETAKRLGMSWAIVESEASEEKNAQVDGAAKDYAYLSTLI